jgi:hypothetical protein
MLNFINLYVQKDCTNAKYKLKIKITITITVVTNSRL